MCKVHSTAPDRHKNSVDSVNNVLQSAHSLSDKSGTIFLVQKPHLFFLSLKACVGVLGGLDNEGT